MSHVTVQSRLWSISSVHSYFRLYRLSRERTDLLAQPYSDALNTRLTKLGKRHDVGLVTLRARREHVTRLKGRNYCTWVVARAQLNIVLQDHIIRSSHEHWVVRWNVTGVLQILKEVVYGEGWSVIDDHIGIFYLLAFLTWIALFSDEFLTID